MNTLKLSALALALSLGLNLEVGAKEYTVLLDKSGSSPLFISEEFKEASINYLGMRVGEMNEGDVIIVRAFGSLDVAANMKVRPLYIKRHNKKKVARILARIIKHSGKADSVQNATNLHAWFGRNKLDCKNGAELIALTDGIESSEYISATHFLNGTKTLPKVHENANLAGCNIHYFGIGLGRSDKETTVLRKAWNTYFKSADAQFEATAL